MRKIKLKAMAKINLGLDVVRKREDGYHEVRMIMQTIRMYDQLQLLKREAPGIRVKTNLYYLPTNEDNLVYKAAKLLMDEFHIRQGLHIDLHKFIPVAAGMAGGSSDAAAVLVGMNRMLGWGFPERSLWNGGSSLARIFPTALCGGRPWRRASERTLRALSRFPAATCWWRSRAFMCPRSLYIRI